MVFAAPPIPMIHSTVHRTHCDLQISASFSRNLLSIPSRPIHLRSFHNSRHLLYFHASLLRLLHSHSPPRALHLPTLGHRLALLQLLQLTQSPVSRTLHLFQEIEVHVHRRGLHFASGDILCWIAHAGTGCPGSVSLRAGQGTGSHGAARTGILRRVDIAYWTELG